MKHLTILLTILFLLGCDKTQQEDNRYWGEVSVLKNGEPWQAKPYAAFESKWGKDYIVILMRSFDNNNFLREGFEFLKVPMELGIYDLEASKLGGNYVDIGASYNTFQDDGHILGDMFLLDTTVTENKLEVLSFDKLVGRIEVRFSATFAISKRQTNESPDTIRFENGYVLTKAIN
jgi:hypothetical protein